MSRATHPSPPQVYFTFNQEYLTPTQLDKEIRVRLGQCWGNVAREGVQGGGGARV